MLSRYHMLLILAILFAARVVGQLSALLFEPEFLPAFEHWDSGLLPYPVLVLAQGLILACQAQILRNVRLAGRFAAPTARLIPAIRRFALTYVGVMLLRYPLTMALVPEMRWGGGAIPIAFHMVLACFLLCWCARPDARKTLCT